MVSEGGGWENKKRGIEKERWSEEIDGVRGKNDSQEKS